MKKICKARLIYDSVKENIENGTLGVSGDKFLSTRDFAEKYEVSLVTAHKIIKQLVDSDLIELSGKSFYLTYGVLGSGTHLAKRQKPRKIIGLHVTNLESPYFSSLARCVEKIGHKKNYDIIISSSGYNYEEEIKAIKLFKRLDVAGIISCPGRNSNLSEVYIKNTIPTVFLSNDLDGVKNDSVVVDNFSAGRQVAKYLLDLGYKNFMYVSQEILRNFDDKRLSGFKSCLEENGAPFSGDSIIYINNELSSNENLIGNALYRSKRPLALFCNNDLLAVEALKACKKWKFEPAKEVGIVGFDDLSIINSYSQSLTTFHYRLEEMVECALDWLLEQIDGKKTEGRVRKINPQLIIRNTTQRVSDSSGEEQ